MVTGVFTENTQTPWFTVSSSEEVHFAAKGDFGGGVLRIEQLINEQAYVTQRPSGTNIAHKTEFDRLIIFGENDVIRLNLSDSSNPVIHWSISGNIYERG